MEEGFVKGASDNLPKVDSIMIDEFYMNNLNFLSAELRNVKSARNKKRSLSEEKRDVVPRKKRKSSNSSIYPNKTKGKMAHELDLISKGHRRDLPHFGFGHNLIYETKDVGDLQDWLRIVDILKKRNNWTDLETMNKVLERLKGINEIYTWLGNVSKILKWDEWKKKLIEIFPKPNDYGLLVRKMIQRKKKPTETYVDYYIEKMTILSSMGITDERAVSCLIGGISDVVDACVARIGQYKNPGELLLYFKTCDSKKPPVAEESLPKVDNKTRRTPKKLKKNPCIYCQARTPHLSRHCPRRSLKDIAKWERKKIEASRQKKAARKLLIDSKLSHSNRESEDQNHEKDAVEKSQSRDTTERPLSSSEQKSSTIKPQEREDKGASKVKPQENVAPKANSNTSSSPSQEKREDKQSTPPSKPTSTSTPPKRNNDTDRGTKQNPDDGKAKSSTVTEKQSKESNGDACFVKPQPPVRKSTSSPSQAKVSSPGRSHAQSDIGTGSTSAAKQTESHKKDTYSAPQKPQSKENKVDSSSLGTHMQKPQSKENKVDSSSLRTQTQKPQSKENKLDSSSPRTHTQKLQSKENKVDSSSPRTQTQKPQSKENKLNSSSPRTHTQKLQSKENKVDSSSPRTHTEKPQSKENKVDSSRAHTQKETPPKPRAYNERSNAGTSATKPQEQRKESSHSRSQDRREEKSTSRAQSKDFLNFSKPQTPIGSSNPNRGSYRHQDEVGYRNASSAALLDERSGGYSSRVTSATSRQEWRDEDYYGRGSFSARSQRDIEESYVNRGTSGATLQNWRDDGYSGRGMSDIRSQEYLERSYFDRESYINSGYGDVDRSRSSIRPHDERDVGYSRPEDQSEGGYSRRDLLSAGYQEQGAYNVGSYEERDIGYVSGRGMSYVRPEDQSEGIYSSRDLLSARYQELMGCDVRSQDERDYISRGISNVRPDEHSEANYSSRDLLSARYQELMERYERERNSDYIRSDEHNELNYPSRDLLSARYQERVDRDIRSQDERDRESDYVSGGTSNVRPDERSEANYPSRDLLSARYQELMDQGVRSQGEREKDPDYISRGMTNVRPDEHSKVDYPSRDLLSARYQERIERDGFNARSQDNSDYISRGTSNVIPEEQSKEIYARGDLSADRYQERTERGLSSIRPQEERGASYSERGRAQGIEVDNVNKSISGDGRRRDAEIEGRSVNKGILKNQSPMQDEAGNIDRNPSGTRPEEEWVSSYVDKDTTGFRHEARVEEDNINKTATVATRPEEKQSEGRGFKSVGMEKTYLNRDEPSARPRDVSYPIRGTPTANPREYSDASRLSRTAPRERLPASSEPTSYFSKSIASTRLLGSSFSSLFNLSLASRPFTSYPSCVTAAKPLGLGIGSSFNRDVPYNRTRALNERNVGVSNAMYSRRDTYAARGPQPTVSSYNKDPASVKHQEQSHRELCLKCYTIGHNSADCPRFRTT